MKISVLLLLTCQLLTAQVIHKIDFDRFTHYEKDDWITYSYSNDITSIDIGINNIYFATNGGGILQYDIFKNEWLNPLTSSNGLSDNHIIKVIYDRSTNELYARTKRGVDVYNDAFEYWQPTSHSVPKLKGPEYSEENNVLPPFSRPNFEKWPTFFPIKNYTIMLDGTLYNPENEEYTIGDRIVDNWDRMWLATNGSGIGVADLQSLEVDFVKQSIPAIRPKDVLAQGDDIWIGGEPYIFSERGIAHWDYNKNKWTYYKSGFNYNIFSDKISVIEKSAGKVFFGTEQGLLMFNPKEKVWKNLRNTFPLKNDAINDLCNINDTLYIATDNGVFAYDYNSGAVEQISKRYINQTKVNSLTGLKSGLYIATNYGIFKYNRVSGDTEILKSKAAIADNFIEAVAGRKNRLWFSGPNGIGFYNIKTGQWRSFSALKYALKSKINHIALTRGNAWFATDDGLLKYNIKRDYWYLYTIKDGLTDNRVSRIETDGDYLWLATYGGVTLFCWNREDRME